MLFNLENCFIFSECAHVQWKIIFSIQFSIFDKNWLEQKWNRFCVEVFFMF